MKLLGFQGGLSPIACLRMIFSSTCLWPPGDYLPPPPRRLQKWLECQNGWNDRNEMAAGLDGRAPPGDTSSPVPRDGRDWAPLVVFVLGEPQHRVPPGHEGRVTHGPRSPHACAAAGPLFAIRLRSDACGRGFGPILPASVPGLQMPGFDARCSPPRRTSGSNSLELY